jgi:glycosyltransferase involved in cell wall biosynthesis
MKALIVATSYKPKNLTEDVQSGKRSRIEYLELSDQLPADYMDYDPPSIHQNKLARKIEERIHVDFFWAYEIAQKVKREKFDVVLSMSERIAVPLGIMLDSRVKHIAILHNTMAHKWLAAIKLLNLPERWSHIFTFSQAEVDALRIKLSIRPDKINRLLSYVDIDFFNPVGVTVDDKAAPFVLSQGLAKRDYPTLIRAMRKLPHVSCQISAVSAWDNFKAGYEGMDIPLNVQFRSYNNQELIRNATIQSRCVVIPLRIDAGVWCAGLSSVLQAQALGRPVIVTHLPGIAEHVRNGETGYVVQGNDPQAMAAAIDCLWKDPQRAAEMGRNAQQWVRENYALEKYVGQFTAVMNRVVEAGNIQDKSSTKESRTNPLAMDVNRNEGAQL